MSVPVEVMLEGVGSSVQNLVEGSLVRLAMEVVESLGTLLQKARVRVVVDMLCSKSAPVIATMIMLTLVILRRSCEH
jgi:hypothetical protein